MRRVASICILFCLSLMCCLQVANAELAPIEEHGLDNKEGINRNSERQESINELLGPKDNFPFLPDNHRDSGTGKFRAFN